MLGGMVDERKTFHIYGETLSADGEVITVEIVARARRLRSAYAALHPHITVGGVRRGVDWALAEDPLQTFHLVGETPEGVECEEIISARTQVAARRAMRRAYPGVDIVETHLLDDDG